MPTGCRSGRESARIAWKAIKKYLESESDKNVQFTSANLSDMGVPGYNGRGLLRLKNRGIIKIVDIKTNTRRIYTLDDRIIGLPLEKISEFSYSEITRKYSQ